MATDVHVLNVGAGSCTVAVTPNGHVTMVDINDGSDQRDYEPTPSQMPLTDPIAWLTHTLGTTSIFRFILSHPDADHMAGIRRLLAGALEITNFWDLPHRRVKTEFRNKEAELDWRLYDAFRKDIAVEGISWPKRIGPMRDETGDFWTGDQIEVLSPRPGLVTEADSADSYNDASYVLRFRNTTSSVLLASDIEDKAWHDMMDSGVRLRSNVLIAAHHGRQSGFCEDAMELIRPEVVIVSTSKLAAKDDAIDDYKRHARKVLSTRVDGDTTVRMWDDGDLDVYNSAGDRLIRLHD